MGHRGLEAWVWRHGGLEAWGMEVYLQPLDACMGMDVWIQLCWI